MIALAELYPLPDEARGLKAAVAADRKERQRAAQRRFWAKYRREESRFRELSPIAHMRSRYL